MHLGLVLEKTKWYNSARVAAHTNDDAFHEIQLNGKQLVFLFMSATVVSVVIFLLGVLVGRNVRVQRTAVAHAEEIAQSPAPDAAVPPAPSQPLASADPTVAAPPPTVDDTTAVGRTESAQSRAQADVEAEVLRPAAPRAVPGAAVQAKPVSAPDTKKPVAAASSTVAADKAATTISTSGSTQPTGEGFAVQVAALNVKGEADAIAKRLNAKGYAAYVQMPTTGTPNVFRVRVGTFKTRREAESVAAKLQKEERFKPWVTR